MSDHVFAFTIGAMAKAAGVTTPTIRYYEGIGLLPRPVRSAAQQRVYTAADLDRLIFVRRCRDFGFGIETVRSLLGMSVRADKDCSSTREIVAAHLSGLRQQLAELKALETQLAGFVMRCDDSCAGGAARDCAIFADLGCEPAPNASTTRSKGPSSDPALVTRRRAGPCNRLPVTVVRVSAKAPATAMRCLFMD